MHGIGSVSYKRNKGYRGSVGKSHGRLAGRKGKRRGR